MANIIQIKSGTTEPIADNLADKELGYYNKGIYIKDSNEIVNLTPLKVGTETPAAANFPENELFYNSATKEIYWLKNGEVVKIDQELLTKINALETYQNSTASKIIAEGIYEDTYYIVRETINQQYFAEYWAKREISILTTPVAGGSSSMIFRKTEPYSFVYPSLFTFKEKTNGWPFIMVTEESNHGFTATNVGRDCWLSIYQAANKYIQTDYYAFYGIGSSFLFEESYKPKLNFHIVGEIEKPS